MFRGTLPGGRRAARVLRGALHRDGCDRVGSYPCGNGTPRRATCDRGPPSVAGVLARTRTLAISGVEAVPVDVEIDIHRGLPAFTIVGLPDAAVRESRERVRAALVNSGFDFPLQRITANLAPADLRKAGPGYDLAIAAAILVASDQLAGPPLEGWWLAGELALDGGIRPLPGALAMAERVEREGGRGFAVPAANAPEAGLIEGPAIAPVGSLADLRTLAAGEIPPATRAASRPVPRRRCPTSPTSRASPASAAASRSPRREVMRRSSSGRPAPASRWPHDGCRRSCRRSRAARRSR